MIPDPPLSEMVIDEDRLAALDRYDILDTPPEKGFDDIVKLATLVCDVPVALVSLVASDRQWFKANIGFPHHETDLNSSVCAHALVEPDLLVIPDLTVDPRTCGNPLVTGEPHIRFYAGAPLRTPRGQVLGSLCVIDKASRPGGLTERQAEVLRNLAGQVVTLLELRRSVAGRDTHIARRRQVEQRMGEVHARLQISEAHWRGLFERLNEGLIIGEVVRDMSGQAVDWRYLDVNPAWGELVGIDPADVVGRTIREVFPGIEEEWIQEFNRVTETGEPMTFTRQVGSLSRWYEGRAFRLEGDRFAALFLEVTERVLAEIRRNAVLEVGDELRDFASPEEMIAKASAIVGQALGVTRAGYGVLDREGEHVTIGPDWTAPGMPSIAGRHRFADWGDIREELLLGEPLVICDARSDPRTAEDQMRWAMAQIRALVNIPVQERGRTVGVFIVQDDKPRTWDQETIAFLRNVADRLTAGVARLEAESEQQMLNGELSHRMKNMLTMVQAIAGQTLKGVTEQDAVTAFRQRLHALASAHDVLLQTSWASASMREVVRAVLRASGSLDHAKVHGPDVTLGPRATLSLSLLLHELTTNAVKYGALSVEAGRIDVAWRLEAEELVLDWIERDGPPAVEPTRCGFGSRLIRSGLIGTGGVTLRYLASGFEAEMRARLEQVQAT